MTTAAPETSPSRMRAYRYALDLTEAQATAVAQHAGAARWAFNHALAVKQETLSARMAAIAAAVEGGQSAAEAAEAAPKVPSKPTIQKALNQVKGDDRAGVDGLCPWWHCVSTYAFQSAFADADQAWKNWLDSVTGRRAGRRVGRPRFKRKNRSRDSFRIHHDVTNPTIRLAEGSRRLIVPRLGSLRVHNSTKRLRRALRRGGIVQSVTVSRGGHRWYASVLVKEPATTAAATKRQRAAGTIGGDVGVRHLAALFDGTIIENPRHLAAARRRLTKAQRTLSRTKKGSNRRRRAAEALGRRHHEIAERRATTVHTLTKQLATGWATVAVEDLNVAGMTRSARGTTEEPGTNVAAKAGLNRRCSTPPSASCDASSPTRPTGTAHRSQSAIAGPPPVRRVRSAEREPSSHSPNAYSAAPHANTDTRASWTVTSTRHGTSPPSRWPSPPARRRRKTPAEPVRAPSSQLGPHPGRQ